MTRATGEHGWTQGQGSAPCSDSGAGLGAAIGERLRAEREARGLSQAALAAMAGTSRNTQGHYERGVRVPDAVYLARVAAAGLDAGFIVTGRRSVLY